MAYKPNPAMICGALRRSFKDAEFVYKNGACFELFLILRTIFPKAEPWWDGGHVWTKIDGAFYDIDGRLAGATDHLKPMFGDRRLLWSACSWSRKATWRVDTAAALETQAN